MDDDWDLHAVVRGCAAVSITTTTTDFKTDSPQNSFSYPFSVEKSGNCLFSAETRNRVVGDLRDLYMPFLHESSLSVVSSLSCLHHPQQQEEQKKKKQNKRPLSISVSPSTATSQAASSKISRSKRRKIQQKKVCHVPAEALNSDVWAWRKYGQKPIKSSPFPRGYYRCSTSKGCLARKQVERNRSDPTMFIVTYTAEHNHPAPTHRNSLAGSTRQKPSDPTALPCAATDHGKFLATSTEELIMAESTSVEDLFEGEADLGSLSDTVFSDDFFEGLEGFTDESFSGESPGSFGLPWLAAGGV